MKLQDKVAVVTGAGRGIGRANGGRRTASPTRKRPLDRGDGRLDPRRILSAITFRNSQNAVPLISDEKIQAKY
ncbi:MAG TPA: hypothetical protein VGM32_18225 [Rhodopila sp.]|jgi:hypothetical protein